MGLLLSWIAAKGSDRADMLGVLGLQEVGEPGRTHPVPPPAKFAAFELGEWLFIISSDMRFADRERICAASQGGAAIGAYLEEHVMVSGSFGALGGRLAWSVQHDPGFGMEHLDIWGSPPAELADIRTRLVETLQANGDADYLFDAPTDLAAAVCGFNPNSFDDEVDATALTVVRRDLMKLREQPLASALSDPGVTQPAPPPRQPGFLARLFRGR